MCAWPLTPQRTRRACRCSATSTGKNMRCARLQHWGCEVTETGGGTGATETTARVPNSGSGVGIVPHAHFRRPHAAQNMHAHVSAHGGVVTAQAHYDYFHDTLNSQVERGGQRVLTMLMYLSTPDEGACSFPQQQQQGTSGDECDCVHHTPCCVCMCGLWVGGSVCLIAWMPAHAELAPVSAAAAPVCCSCLQGVRRCSLMQNARCVCVREGVSSMHAVLAFQGCI